MEPDVGMDCGFCGMPLLRGSGQAICRRLQPMQSVRLQRTMKPKCCVSSTKHWLYVLLHTVLHYLYVLYLYILSMYLCQNSGTISAST